MSLLQTIRAGKTQGPPRLLIYGTEGIGKSTFGASAPKPIFIPTEDGLDNIDCASFPLCKTFTEVMNCLEALLNDPHDYQTVVVDTLDWLERLIWDHTCQQYRADNIEKVDGGYGKGYTIVLTHWRKFIDTLRSLREQRGMIIILLANALVVEWCDAILMATREYGAAKGEKSGGQRILRCERSAACSAKNRYGLPDILPLSWKDLYGALVAGAQK